MNQLNVSLQHSILTLAAHGWSHRRIARELDIHRETVGKYLRLADSKPAISTPGSEADPASKPAISTPGPTTGRQSLCQPWQPQIEAAVAVGLSAQRIYQDLVVERGFSGSYQAVKRFVRQLRQTQPVPFVRMEVEPGAEAQVDFGQGAWRANENDRICFGSSSRIRARATVKWSGGRRPRASSGVWKMRFVISAEFPAP
jgi:transposase